MPSRKPISHTDPSADAINPNGSCVSGNPSDQASKLDPEKFRIGQDLAAHINTRKVVISIAVKRPDRQYWVYIHPDPAWQLNVGILEDKINQRTYLVDPHIVSEVEEELRVKRLVAYATRQGTFALWPISLPDKVGRLDSYSESGHVIVAEHAGQWIRIKTNLTDRCYEVHDTALDLAVPQWPDGGFPKLFNLAFRNRRISYLDHPVLKGLREGV
jgi:hypothetical protein